MPTVLRIGLYRFFFFSNESNEPPHIHVERDNWLTPVRLHQSWGFKSIELNKIHNHIAEHQQYLIDQWNEYFK